jgi:serine/threonine-protein kinase
MIGRVVGNYKILEKLGEGGMGAVFKGVDVMVEREVAIKVLRTEIARQPEIVERFRSEAVTLAKLNHPGIATLFSFFRQGDEFFMVMEFVPGRTLEALLAEFGPMPAGQAVPVFSKILAGIEHAHELGILHRDIKPANVMLTTAGAVKVTDFGIARILGAARMTRQGNIVGTLEYIAPERIKGEDHDARSDIYSLGAMLYETLSGHLPFERDNEYAMMQAHLMEPPPPLGRFGLDIPPEVEAVAMRALAKRQEDRFPTTADFAAALATAWTQAQARLARTPKETRMAAAAPPPPKPTRLAGPSPSLSKFGMTPPAGTAVGPAARPVKRPAWVVWAVGALAVVVMAAFGIWFAFSARERAASGGRDNQQQAAPASAAPANRPADPGIPTPGELPKDLQTTPAQEVLKNSVPIPEPIQAGRPETGPAKSADKGLKAVPPATTDAERRRAALRALEEGNPHAADADAKKDGERRRLEALKALQK